MLTMWLCGKDAMAYKIEKQDMIWTLSSAWKWGEYTQDYNTLK